MFPTAARRRERARRHPLLLLLLLLLPRNHPHPPSFSLFSIVSSLFF
jgi:hypothetical protein